jgi:phosphoheptose isomerase
MRNKIKDWIQESIRVKQAIHDDPKIRKQIELASALLTGIIKGNGNVYVCGNGGSASDSAHFVAELMNRFTMLREYPIPAVDLSAMNSTITAISNDYSFDAIYSKQLKALMRADDLLVAITTSGKSHNIIEALKVSNSKGNHSILLTGEGVAVDRDYGISGVQHINVPSNNTPIIQESHIMIIHILCSLLDDALEGK